MLQVGNYTGRLIQYYNTIQDMNYIYVIIYSINRTYYVIGNNTNGYVPYEWFNIKHSSWIIL